MKLSLVFFTFFLIVLLSTADQTEFNTNSCPTSRHLLFFGGFNFPLGGKKTEHVSSSSKPSSKSSPSKYARTDHTHGLTIYIRPQTSSELGKKVHSYSHLLQSKLYTKEELAKLKKLKSDKKKPSTKKKNATQHASKTRDLVAVNDQERDRCRALLQIDHQNSLIPPKENKKIKKVKNSISTKVKNITTQAKKKVAAAAKALPIKEKQTSKKTKPSKTDTKPTSDQKIKPTKSSKTKSAPEEKVKPTKSNTKSTSNEKKKPSDTEPLTPPPVKEIPIKKPASSSPPPPSSPPPVQSSTNTKSKREKAPPPVIEEPAEPLDINESDEIDNEEKNNSVVGRAYYFVKNMFQLSDDILENNHTHEEDQIIFPPTNEQQQQQQQQQQHRPSRKLLSIDDNDNKNNYQLDDIFNDLSLSDISISKRQLLSVKANKHSISSKTTKEKKTNSDVNKPKVGWAYRYRISRFLADQKMKRSGRGNKAIGGGKSKQQQQQHNKKTSSSSNTKVSKRKLLELDFDDETNLDNYEISNQDIVNTVSITQDFVPKRQLLSTKKSAKHEATTDDESDIEKMNERRRMKSFEELTDPVEIVRSYDRGLFKPRVGWQFRYRVSRYIDSLRDNIREDQERLKLGLEAIKRKTPQELSGRRKRVLDKPFTTEPEEVPAVVEDNKPNVGWRYRYRISKMLDAKKRGEYIDDDELKRQARVEQKRKQHGIAKPAVDDDECIEWEYDIDPELRKIGEEGKRVGWAYRYRIRRKLDELKQIQAETGVPFDIETLGGKREKKVSPTAATSADVPDEKQAETNKKAVGWQYRYRVSKMREAQKQEAAEALKKPTSKKRDHVPVDERLDPELARLTPEARVVGWQYRYRIRRKLEALKNASRETEGGKRGKKHKLLSEPRTSSKRDEKIIKKVEESIEKILNIDDIEETPFMEYFRRASSYIFFGLLPTFRKSICLLPLPVTFSFCNEDEDEHIKETLTTTGLPKLTPTKKLRTKKEKRAKQFIHSRSTSLDTTDEKIDDPVKPLLKTPSATIEKSQTQKKPSRQRLRSSIRRTNDEQVKHFDEEEEPVKKLIGVESKKKKNKKRFQIIGQEVKTKPKHSTVLPVTNSPPIASTIPSTPATTTTTVPPVVQTPRTTSPSTPSSKPPVVSTTTPAPLRTISEIIQEEAATLLSTKPSFTEETKEEINEANENLQTTTATTPPSKSSADPNENTTSGEGDNDSTSTDNESSSSSSSNDSDSNEENEENDDKSDASAVKKMKQFYENAKESVHGVFDLKDEKDSS